MMCTLVCFLGFCSSSVLTRRSSWSVFGSPFVKAFLAPADCDRANEAMQRERQWWAQQRHFLLEDLYSSGLGASPASASKRCLGEGAVSFTPTSATGGRTGLVRSASAVGEERTECRNLSNQFDRVEATGSLTLHSCCWLGTVTR